MIIPLHGVAYALFGLKPGDWTWLDRRTYGHLAQTSCGTSPISLYWANMNPCFLQCSGRHPDWKWWWHLTEVQRHCSTNQSQKHYHHCWWWDHSVKKAYFITRWTFIWLVTVPRRELQLSVFSEWLFPLSVCFLMFFAGKCQSCQSVIDGLTHGHFFLYCCMICTCTCWFWRNLCGLSHILSFWCCYASQKISLLVKHGIFLIWFVYLIALWLEL